MSTILQFLLKPTQAPRSVLLVRIAVGLIFFSQGILKYIDPNMGVVRFTRIGFSHPYFTAHFVGTFEILCGLLLLLGIDRDHDCDCDYEDSRIVSRKPGFLVHGQRCPHRFRHVLLLGLSHLSRWRELVS